MAVISHQRQYCNINVTEVVARQHSLGEGLFCCCDAMHPPHSAATVSRMDPAFIPILPDQHSHQAVAHSMANAH